MDCKTAIDIHNAIWSQTEDRLRSVKPSEILTIGRRMAGIRRILSRVAAATMWGGCTEEWVRRRLSAAARAMAKEFAA